MNSGLLVHGLFDVSGIDRKAVRSVIMASVVPPLTSPARGMVERYFDLTAMVVEPGLETGMPILYDTPADVGADRIVNGIAAYEQYGRAAAAARWSSSISGPRRRSTRSARRASISVARSVQA